MGCVGTLRALGRAARAAPAVRLQCAPTVSSHVLVFLHQEALEREGKTGTNAHSDKKCSVASHTGMTKDPAR